MSNNVENKTVSSCKCQGADGVFFNAQQLSWLVAGGLVFSGMVFISSYFLGKKSSYEQLAERLEQDSFADHIYYSMCALYDSEVEEASEDGDKSEDTSSGPLFAAVPLVTTTPTAVQEPVHPEVDQSSSYFAPIAGYGSEKEALKLVQRLSAHGIPAQVKKRQGKTGKNHKIVTWYQVVTDSYTNKADLLAVLDPIKSITHVKDIQILSC